MRLVILLPVAGCAIGTLANDDDTSTGGGDGCTGYECVDGFVIGLVRDEWDEGDYVFEIDVDSSVTTCEYTLPMANSYDGGCDDESVLIGTSSGDAGAFYEIVVSSTTATAIEVTITLDGHDLANETFTPDYELVQPNGVGCDPVCTYDEEAMVVD